MRCSNLMDKIIDEKFHAVLDLPYAGLFGDTVAAAIIQEIIADPHAIYHPKDLQELTGKSAPSVRSVLKALTALKILNVFGSDNYPSYQVNTDSKKFVALTLLAYAMIDDLEKTDTMDTAIRHYYQERFKPDSEPLAIATDKNLFSYGVQTGSCARYIKWNATESRIERTSSGDNSVVI